MIKRTICFWKKWIPEHKYCYAMLYMIFYLVVFFTLDFTVTPKYIIHCRLDDVIPFCEYFAIPYAIWFPAFILALLLYMYYDKEEFQQLWFIMFTGATICFLIYIILPNGLELRVDIPNRNLLCMFLNILWNVDSPANVCPSLHVSTSIAIALVTARSGHFKGKRRIWQVLVILLMILICISTMFVKQHSAVDVFCGAVLSAALYVIAYHTNWRKLFYGTKLEILM